MSLPLFELSLLGKWVPFSFVTSHFIIRRTQIITTHLIKRLCSPGLGPSPTCNYGSHPSSPSLSSFLLILTTTFILHHRCPNHPLIHVAAIKCTQLASSIPFHLQGTATKTPMEYVSNDR